MRERRLQAQVSARGIIETAGILMFSNFTSKTCEGNWAQAEESERLRKTLQSRQDSSATVCALRSDSILQEVPRMQGEERRLSLLQEHQVPALGEEDQEQETPSELYSGREDNPAHADGNASSALGCWATGYVICHLCFNINFGRG